MSDDWPAWATQRIEIHGWDATWQQQTAALIADLHPLLERRLEGPIGHVGSTEVDGVAAKPVIDQQAPAALLVGSEPADDPLVEAGWQLAPPELDQRAWRPPVGPGRR